MNCKTYEKGAVIFRQGDFAETMFDIVSGSVGVYVGFGTENETCLTILKAGDFLGEMGMIEYFPRSATAVALEDGTELREIGEDEFSDYFKNQPERLLAIMRQFSRRLRELTEDYESACSVLEELKSSDDDPGSSRPSPKNIDYFLSFYNSVMSAFGESTYMSYLSNEFYQY